MVRARLRTAILSGTAPRASIIVPCFNDGATLSETVESIRSEPDAIELVVVDDGSTDSFTLTELADLEQGGLRVIRQPNQGPAAACMAGLRATSAQYVMRVDADDLLEQGAIAALAVALDDAPHAAAAWGDVQTFGLTTFRIPAAPSLDPWLLTYVNCIPPSAGCLLRRSAVLEAGGWQLRHGHEDWDLWMAFAERGWHGVYVPRVAVRYRRDESGRYIESLGLTEAHYDELRRRHVSLFARRSENRLSSQAPRALKLVVPVVERLPRVPRLARIQLCELFTHLLWNGGPRATATMTWQAARWRIAARMRSAPADRPD